MRHCPSCNSTYTDDTLTYCLTDGTPLVSDTAGSYDPAQTLVASSPQTGNMPATPPAPTQAYRPDSAQAYNFQTSPPSTPAWQNQYAPPSWSTQPSRTGRTNRKLIVGVVVGLLLIVGVGIFIYLRNRGSDMSEFEGSDKWGKYSACYDGRVYYNTSSESDKANLCNYLVAEHIFFDGTPRKVKVVKSGAGASAVNEVEFDTQGTDGKYKDLHYKGTFQQLADELSGKVFGGRKVEVQLTDDEFSPYQKYLSSSGGNTPTDAMQIYYGALKNKDINALKSVMPKEAEDEGEKEAKDRGISFDDLIKMTFFDKLNYEEASKLPDKVETRNETIASDGRTATVEVKALDADRWYTIHFIKEDGVWKLSKDDFILK